MADPPPPVAQPDELSPLDYLLHRGESHPAARSAFLNLEILDRPADWGRLREALGRTSRVVIRMPGHHSGPGVDGYLDRTDSVHLRQDLPDRSTIRPIWVHSGLVTINSKWAVPPSRRRSLIRPMSGKSDPDAGADELTTAQAARMEKYST